MPFDFDTRVWRLVINAGHATPEHYAQARNLSLGTAKKRLELAEGNDMGQHPMIPTILELKGGGLSMGEIAAKLGMTRNAVIGLTYRERQRLKAEEEARRIMATLPKITDAREAKPSNRRRAPVETLITPELPEEREARINAMVWRGVEARRARLEAAQKPEANRQAAHQISSTETRVRKVICDDDPCCTSIDSGSADEPESVRPV